MTAKLPDDLSFLAPPDRIADWRMVVAYSTAAEAGLIEALPARADELGAQLQLDPRAVEIVLDALGGWSIVDRDGDGRYSLGPNAPDADAAATLWHHARVLRRWTGLGESLREPLPPQPQREPVPPDVFQAALAVGARRRAPALVDLVLERVGTVSSMLDLGGGHGEYALEFARRGIQAVLQDRSSMIDAARRRGVVPAGGVELFEGDFFEALPGREFDLVLVAGVTHTYDEAHNRRLLERVHGIVRHGGAVVIVTMLQRRSPVASLFAVQMRANGGGGDTHAEAAYRRWLADTGFVDVNVADIGAGPQSALIARRSSASDG